MNKKLRIAAVLAAAIVAVLATGCGDDDKSATSPSTGSTNPQSKTSSGGAVATDNSCRLTVKQVTEVVGVEMKDRGSCIFGPVTDKLFPRVGYNKQYALAFEKDALAQEAYKETVTGVGDQAYIKRDADGEWMLVRSKDFVFEVHVDTLNEQADRETVKKLALRVLSGN